MSKSVSMSVWVCVLEPMCQANRALGIFRSLSTSGCPTLLVPQHATAHLELPYQDALDGIKRHIREYYTCDAVRELHAL